MGKKVIVNKVKEFFGLDNPDGAGIDSDIDFNDSGITDIEIENTSINSIVEPQISSSSQNHKLNSPLEATVGGANYQTIFLDPKTYSDCRKIADYVRDEKMVTLNLEFLDEKTAIRLMNFLSGAMTVQGAKYLIISKKVYTIFPKSMRIYYEGKKSEEPRIFENFGREEK
ncbi:cell division protein SepF [uncultured Fusobacterium sp.]|uniref:cell division protein SepF n=1 Tax=uncultured Fusobacterium sp. TaxID=159267 RepID=UPI00258B2457|nr:cell division protein SepF [uncultured Fusobacterium sp.]